MRAYRKNRNPQATGPVPSSYVSRTPFDPEELDFAILREMYRDGAVNLAGIDPRLNATRIARTLRIGRARIATRLRWWKESGFLQKYSVWLNPALLGWHGAWVALRVDHHRSKPGLFQRLSLVDGVVSAMDFLGPWVSVAVVAPDPTSLQRRIRLIRQMPGVEEVDAPVHWRTPEPARALTPLEVRVARALRATPTATLSEIAQRVGVSTRTMTRRYSEMIERWTVWFVPIFDFTALSRPIVSVNIRLRPGVAKEEISRAVRQRFPLALDFAATGIGPEVSPQDLVVFVALPSPASLEELEQFLTAMEGVEGVESFLLVRMHDFPEWFDDHLASLAAPSPDRAGGRRAGSRR